MANFNFNTQHNLTDWVIVYATRDEWEARLIRTALLSAGIRCEMQPSREIDGTERTIITVRREKELDALEVAGRVTWAIADEISARSDMEGQNGLLRMDESIEWEQTVSEPVPTEQQECVPDALPTTAPAIFQQTLIASREGIGEIVHIVGRGYELRVGQQPYYLVEEGRWEEFTDFSAQRQEFAILLKGEYPKLFKWLKDEKLMAEFIKLVESTYREVPPPRPRRRKRKQRNERQDTHTNKYAIVGFCLSLISIAAFILESPWYAIFALAFLAFFTGFVAKCQIGVSEDEMRGNLWATIGLIIAFFVMVLSLIQHY